MKFMPLQDYGGVEADVAPMSEWTPAEIEAHITYQKDLNAELRERESKELLAGYRMVDVESLERALKIAAKGSAAPGPGGVPIEQSIEVREVMGPIEH
jgi:hypothetical protein